VFESPRLLTDILLILGFETIDRLTDMLIYVTEMDPIEWSVDYLPAIYQPQKLLSFYRM
jgi:hypothetical protein